MRTISETAILNYSSKEIFDLVNELSAYPDFLPGITAVTILSEDSDEVKATLTIAKGGFTKSFTTLNRLQAYKMIEMRLIEGPFKHLEGFWRFEELSPNRCKISLDLEFEFAGWLLDMALGPLFHQLVGRFIQAFTQRAKVVYGH